MLKRLFTGNGLLIIILIVCVLGSCKKNNPNDGTRGNLAIINLVPDSQPLDVKIEGNSILGGSTISYDSISGVVEDPYLKVVTGINNITVSPASGNAYINGNISFEANQYYSLFFYDSAASGSVQSVLLHDNLTAPADTMVNVRFLNFSSDTLTVAMGGVKDTLGFAGIVPVNPNVNTASLSFFSTWSAGKRQISVYVDSVLVLHPDSVTLAGGKIYTFYAKGNLKSTAADSLVIKNFLNN